MVQPGGEIVIIVKGTLKLGVNGVERLGSTLATMISATRAEPGCDHYAIDVDGEDADLLHVSERWVDQAALGQHLVSDHVVAFQMAMRRTRLVKGDVRIHYPDGSIKRLIDV